MLPGTADASMRPASAVAIALTVLLGAALTFHGLSAASAWRAPDHVKFFLYLWAFVAAGSLLTGIGALGVGLLTGTAIVVATGNLPALLAVALVGWSATALGRLVMARHPSTADLEALLIGLVLYGSLIGLLVQLPVNYVGVYTALLLLPLGCAPRRAAAILTRARRTAGAPRSRHWLAWLAGTAAAALATVHLLVALMPEIGHDALATHLMLPSRIAWAHVWSFDVERHVWAVMPMLGDWLYTIGYMLGGETAARLVNLGCLLLLGQIVCGLVQWSGGDALAARAAVLLLLSTPLALTETSSLFVESIWTCLLVGGALALLRLATRAPGDTSPVAQHAVSGGVLLGGALAAKAVTLLALPPLGVVLLLRWRRWLRRELASALAIAALAFVAIASVPYVRAFVQTGNPLFPFWNGYFKSPYWAPQNIDPPPRFAKGTSWDVLYRMTFESQDYLEAMPGAPGFQWLLLLLPAVVVSVSSGNRRPLVLVAVAAAALWLTFHQTAYLRYVLPSFVLAIAAMGSALTAALPVARVVRWLLIAATAATITLNLRCFTRAGFYAELSLPVLLNDDARNEWLLARAPFRSAVLAVNRLNLGHAPVALFGDAYATDLRADMWCPNWYNMTFHNQVEAAATPERLGHLLAEHRIDYVILSHGWWDEVWRQRVRDVTDAVCTIGSADVRRLRSDYRFPTELLHSTTFAEDGHWQLVGDARVERGAGATVTVGGHASQVVEVRGGGEYSLTAQVRRSEADVATDAALQIEWLDAERRVLRPDLHVVPCTADGRSHTFVCTAPAGAVAAVVDATARTPSPVVVERLSFRK